MYILTVLGAGAAHGYRIMSEVEEMSDGVVRLGPGTLYGSIKRMLGQGLIEETAERPDPELDDERRRYYQLTAYGAAVGSAELERLSLLAAAARTRWPVRPVPGLSW